MGTRGEGGPPLREAPVLLGVPSTNTSSPQSASPPRSPIDHQQHQRRQQHQRHQRKRRAMVRETPRLLKIAHHVLGFAPWIVALAVPDFRYGCTAALGLTLLGFALEYFLYRTER